MSSHQAGFEALAGLVSADTGATGLTNSSSISHLFGGFFRRGDPRRTSQPPWLEYEVAGEREQDAMGRQRMDLVIRIHHFTKRDTVFSALQGNQNSLVTRTRAVFHNVTPGGTQQGWTCNKLYRTGGQQVPDDGNFAHYVDTYLMRLNA